MDCWSSSFAVVDEFEKLVLRMNPPRYFVWFSLVLVIWGVHFPNWGSFVFLKFLFFFSWNGGVWKVLTLWIYDFNFLLMWDTCRVTVDNTSSRKATLIKVFDWIISDFFFFSFSFLGFSTKYSWEYVVKFLSWKFFFFSFSGW